MEARINAIDGMLYYIVEQIRPDLAAQIKKTGDLKTMIIGLGGQGSKHAGLMHSFGTHVAAGVAPGRGGTRVHETIPVYNSVQDCLRAHPDIAAASIWRHYATARDAVIEVIQAGIPLVVLISEGIPLRDVRDILVAAREHGTVLIGGNTPGLIFPPEKIKIGMLPDVFYPEESAPGQFGPRGVTIISRSGAILYHMSDAMASAGIAQNAVIGIGGDGAIGSTFKDLVPLVMGYENTDLVIVAGEIGGCLEEMLASDFKDHPEKYPKPLVALISGAHAPEGKTMGHAGAIVTPGLETGTFKSKKKALESAGIPVVNSQFDLIDTVKEKLGGKTYFKPEHYYDKMRRIWEAPPPKPSWGTMITMIAPNRILVRGYALPDLIKNVSLISAAHLIMSGELPDSAVEKDLSALALEAAHLPVPRVGSSGGETARPSATQAGFSGGDAGVDAAGPAAEDVSKALARYLLCDEAIHYQPASAADPEIHGYNRWTGQAVWTLGRCIAYLAHILGNEGALHSDREDASFPDLICRLFTGKNEASAGQTRILEAMITASIDHGVTPPSAQAAILAASVRAPYEVAVAHGIGAITDVHGGAGQNAAKFFLKCVEKAGPGEGGPARSSGEIKPESLERAVRDVIAEYVKAGHRIEGMGHRLHTQDPRRDILWKLAEETGVEGSCVAISKMASDLLRQVRGLSLPINVDGVIGAISADMGLDPKLAKVIFILGRVLGLSAHYVEEISTQSPMRRINFAQAVYRGKKERSLIR